MSDGFFEVKTDIYLRKKTVNLMAYVDVIMNIEKESQE
jgi:hypothetical protein